MSDIINVIGDDKLIEDLRNADKVVRNATRAIIDDLAAYSKGRVKAYIMDAGAVDLGELLQGVHIETDKGRKRYEAVIRPSNAADEYAIYVERGARPHTPPVDALRGWAQRHGIPVWAVVRKIQREGTEPRWMWRDAFEDIQGKSDDYVDALGLRIAREI